MFTPIEWCRVFLYEISIRVRESVCEELWGRVLHKCVKTTHRIKVEIQQSKESVTSLSRKYGITENTIRKWK